MNDPIPPNSAHRHVVAPVSDLPAGQRKIVTIKGRTIGVFHLNGEYYALRNICPHRGGPLCQGRLRPLVAGNQPNHLEYDREGEILKCPWHQWEFDIKSGQALYDQQLRVKTYLARREGDEVVVYV